MRSLLILVRTIAIAAAAACYVGPIEHDARPTSDRQPTEPTGSGGAGTGQNGDTPSGLPCDVDALLAKRCRSCHVQGGAAPMALVTYEDLTSPSKSNASKSTAAACIERLRSATQPMPPAPLDRVPSDEIVALETWVAAGMPRGECGGSKGGVHDGTSDTSASSVCTSGVFWSSGRKGSTMRPGNACISCHERQEDEPVVWIGGTVYPTLHEPNDCYGISGDVTVVITDAAGRVVSLPVGPTGNFSLSARASGPPAMPIRAKVVRNGVERVMATPQSSGDCNGCHTENGANGAPGRILVP